MIPAIQALTRDITLPSPKVLGFNAIWNQHQPFRVLPAKNARFCPGKANLANHGIARMFNESNVRIGRDWCRSADDRQHM